MLCMLCYICKDSQTTANTKHLARYPLILIAKNATANEFQ